MPLQWTHDTETCPSEKGCLENTECPAFPTVQDRKNMALAAFEAYAEEDGTEFADFVTDIALLVLMNSFASEPPEVALGWWVERFGKAVREKAGSAERD